MKACPFCGAELREDARFCVHCMSSLDEKTPWKAPRVLPRVVPIVGVAALLCVLLLGAVLLGRFIGEDRKDGAGETTPSPTETSRRPTADTSASTTTTAASVTTTASASAATTTTATSATAVEGTTSSTEGTTVRTTGPSRADGLTQLPLSAFPKQDWAGMIGHKIYPTEDKAEYEQIKDAYVEIAAITLWEDANDPSYPNDVVHMVISLKASVPTAYRTIMGTVRLTCTNRYNGSLLRSFETFTGVPREGTQVETTLPRSYLTEAKLDVELSETRAGDLDGGNGNEYSALLAEHIAAAEKLGKDEVLSYESTMVGTIIDNPRSRTSGGETVYSFRVSDGVNEVSCYEVPLVGGEPKKGDEVRVVGHLSVYGGYAQFYKENATATLIDDEE